MARKSCCCTCFFFMIFLFVFISHVGAIDLSTEESEYLRTKNTIVFVSQTRYPPFEFTDANKQHEGMMLDMARWMAVEIGFRPVFIDMAFQQAQEAVLSGKADILTSLFHSEKRKERFEFTGTLFDVPASIFVKMERTDIKELKDLNGKTIAIQRGDYAKDFLESKNILFNTLDTKDFFEATDNVIAGKADAVIGDEQIVFYHIFSNRLTDYIKKAGKPLYIGRNCMASNKSNKILISILNKGINEARKSGVLNKISTKWLGTKYGYQRSSLERYLWPLFVFVGCMLLLSLWVWIWNVRLRKLVEKKTALITHREKALRESENNFRTFFETLDDMIFVGSPEGKIYYTNPAVFKKLGYSPDEFEKMHLLQVHPAEKRQEAEAIFSAMLKGELDTCPLPLQSKTGTLIPVETRGWLGKWNNVDCIYGISKDLTKEQEALQKFNRIFNNNPALMAMNNLSDKKFTDVNYSFLNTLGYSRDQVIGKTSTELDLFVQPEKQWLIAEQLRMQGRIANCELQVKCKDGAILDGLFFGEIIDNQGQKSFLTVMINQTASKKVEKELRESEERFRFLSENMADIVWTLDQKLRTTYVSPSVEKMLGYTPEERTQQTLEEMITPESFKKAIEIYMEKLCREEEQGTDPDRTVSIEMEYHHKNGSLIWMENIVKAMRDHSGKIIGMFGSSRDITERKRVEEALTKSEALYHDLVETSQDLIWQCDAEGHYTYLNPAWEQVFGYKLEEMLGKKFSEFQTAEMAVRDQEEFDRLMKGNQVKGLETIHLGRAGNEIHLVFNAKSLTDKNGKIIGTKGTAYDITHRKEVELALRLETEFNSLVINNAEEGICVCHSIDEFPYVRFTIWNQYMISITGYSMEEINRCGWYQSVYPESDVQKKAIERMRRMHAGDDMKDEEWEITRADGEKRQLLITTRILASNKDQTHVLGVMNDITRRKKVEAEKEELEAQNRQLQKTQSLGRMAGSIAHHFNNLLQAVMGNLELAMKDQPRGDSIIECLSEAMKAAIKAAELSGLMLTYLGQAPEKFEPLDLSEVCICTLPTLQTVMSNNVTLETNLPSPGPIISANANQIKQIIIQLISNAQEAISNRQGVIQLNVGIFSATDIPVSNRFPIDWQPNDNDYACLEVTDTGCGITGKDIENIFDPFFSSKFIGRGLGLPVILGIVRMHRGVVTVRSEFDRGSIFRVFLPVTDEKVACRPDRTSLTREIVREIIVLLVEDEEMLRKLTTSMLTRLGFTVLQAKDGVEAVEVFRQHKDGIRFVLCDLTMPRMNGWETLAALRKLSAGIAVILVSGYDEDSVMKGNHIDHQFQAFLKKPFSMAELAAKVQKVLDREQEATDE